MRKQRDTYQYQLLMTDDTFTRTTDKPHAEGKNSQQYLCTSVATSTCGGERNNSSTGCVVEYVQQLLGANNKRTVARSVTCQLYLIPGSCTQHTTWLLLCIDDDNTHMKSEKIYCFKVLLMGIYFIASCRGYC